MMPVDRTEQIAIRMQLSPEGYQKHKDNLRILPGFENWPKTEDDETLNVKYDFSAVYCGNVDRCLQAVKSVCEDPDVVVSSKCDILEQGRILIYECLKSLEQLINTVKERHEI